jgi:hypothetical protein
MTKEDVISALRLRLEENIAVLKSALADSDESASGEQTKSEGKYDTRAIEAAYLAEAQAGQLALAEESLAVFKRFDPRAFEVSDEVGPGALVEVEQEGEICFYLLAPTAGGLMTTYLGCDVTVITPDSRLYQELIEKKLGDQLTSPALTVTGVE